MHHVKKHTEVSMYCLKIPRKFKYSWEWLGCCDKSQKIHRSVRKVTTGAFIVQFQSITMDGRLFGLNNLNI